MVRYLVIERFKNVAHRLKKYDKRLLSFFGICSNAYECVLYTNIRVSNCYFHPFFHIAKRTFQHTVKYIQQMIINRRKTFSLQIQTYGRLIPDRNFKGIFEKPSFLYMPIPAYSLQAMSTGEYYLVLFVVKLISTGIGTLVVHLEFIVC